MKATVLGCALIATQWIASASHAGEAPKLTASRDAETGECKFWLYPSKPLGWCKVLATSPASYKTRGEAEAAAQGLLGQTAGLKVKTYSTADNPAHKRVYRSQLVGADGKARADGYCWLGSEATARDQGARALAALQALKRASR
jgi:hypothetical protein